MGPKRKEQELVHSILIYRKYLRIKIKADCLKKKKKNHR